MRPSSWFVPDEETLDTPALRALQQRKLDGLLRQVLVTNPFYRRKLARLAFDPSRDLLQKLPFTTRKELEADQAEHPPFGTKLTFPLSHYCRFHQTSGSSGTPLRWLDTADNWNWMKRCWGIIYAAAGITREDRLIYTFSFGPFIGFWAAFDGASSMGNLCLPGGGLTTSARLRMILDNEVTVICCTPTYALRMAEVAAEEGLDIAGSAVRALIVAGEPGGSIPATRKRIESAWGARVFDHTGMTEIGPLAIECEENPGGPHVIESEYIAEVIDPDTLEPVEEGESGELVVTNLGRIGSPVIRYRTGDRVRLTRGRCACGRHYARLEGGIMGRIDDMFIVRGNNVFPSALEAVIRSFADVAEFRVQACPDTALVQVDIDIEPLRLARDSQALAARISQAICDTFNFKADVRIVAPGTLPRFEMKARRFVRSAAGALTGGRSPAEARIPPVGAPAALTLSNH